MTVDELIASRKPPPPVETESDERAGDQRKIRRVISKPIKTLADLSRECEIDLTEWEIVSWKCSAWQTAMKPWRPKGGTRGSGLGTGEKEKAPGRGIRFEPIYSQQFVVSATMRLRHHVIDARRAIEDLKKEAARHSPLYRIPKLARPASADVLRELSVVDHHTGAYIWGEETGGADYDSGIATRIWREAFTTLLHRTAPYDAGRALLVLGNDQLTIDNRAGTTEAGTPQDFDSRYKKIFKVSELNSRWAIERSASVSREVDVIMVPGNHDALSTWHLGNSLEAWFRRFKNIRIHNLPLFRMYFEFGQNMLMFTHGHKGKLTDYGAVMASEQPAMWGRTRWREAHTGDKHHRKELELKGATVRILPSLRPPDAWSSENHFIGSIRAAEAFVWHKSEGLIGTAVYSIPDKQAA